MRHIVPAFTLLFTLFVSSAPAQFKGAEPVSKELKPGYDSISIDSAKEYLSVLAGPNFAGRGTGQPGYTKAAHWVAGKLAEFGFEPLGDRGTYFQFVPMTRVSPDQKNSFITGPNNLRIAGPDQIGFTGFSQRPSVTGKVVVIQLTGTQTKAPDDLVLRDRIAVIVSDVPNATFGFRIRRKRPLATITVTKSIPASRSRLVLQNSARRRAAGVVANISRPAAEKLVAALKLDGKILKPAAKKGVVVHKTDKSLTVQVRMKNEPAGVPNVVGWLEGSDPKLKNEYVTIGAHLDHLGKRNNAVYLGADDNASGSTAILMLARALGKSAKRPKRSVLFISFAAEEMGLIGSKYYCSHPIKPLNKMVCMLNIDMVGRNESRNEPADQNIDTVHLVGSKKGFKGLHELILDANKHVKFRFEYDEENVFRRSDQASFYDKGIPVAFLFAGFHARYHRPTDTLEDINYPKIVAASRLFYLALNKAAEHGRFPKK